MDGHHYMKQRNRGSMEIVRQLLDNDANKNARTDSGWTPLHEAVKKKKIDIVQLLIEKDAEVNANFDNRWTPLHEAVKRKSKEIVQQLLDNGADLSAKMNSGWTPLHEAAKEGNMEIVQQLLDKGANTDARMDNGWTPLDEAITGRDITIVQLMTRIATPKNADYERWTLKLLHEISSNLLSMVFRSIATLIHEVRSSHFATHPLVTPDNGLYTKKPTLRLANLFTKRLPTLIPQLSQLLMRPKPAWRPSEREPTEIAQDGEEVIKLREKIQLLESVIRLKKELNALEANDRKHSRSESLDAATSNTTPPKRSLRKSSDETDYAYLQRYREVASEIGEEFEDPVKLKKNLFIWSLDKPMRTKLDEQLEIPDSIDEIVALATRLRPGVLAAHAKARPYNHARQRRNRG
ncbi:26S proteasome non-ATPase regulatory subunit 10 [Coccidioides immitis RMSCC 3703]|uniref:26S proteasome non-ATPase regulatory subunit 10 n=1 Tax=Coccidioides immitis RMSCC 3703 TaxID=454286 RepID=A0A0J8TJP8_COCIT|nr:26S proteasome non-ATPase regulatory subunit 10 [Coccidioides immitis RMSCC 3703]